MYYSLSHSTITVTDAGWIAKINYLRTRKTVQQQRDWKGDQNKNIASEVDFNLSSENLLQKKKNNFFFFKKLIELAYTQFSLRVSAGN